MGHSDERATRSAEAELLLHHIHRGKTRAAQLLLRDSPYVAESNVFTMAACGHAGSLARALGARPELVSASEESTGWKPLHWAAGSPLVHAESRIARGVHEVLELLLERGVDPNESYTAPHTPHTRGGLTLPALYVAIAHGCNRDAVRLLLARGANPNDDESLYHAAEQESPAFLEELIAWGAKCGGTNALYRALDFGRARHVRLLLDAGCNPDEREPGALHHAILRGAEPDLIELLMRYGADPTMLDYAGRTVGKSAIRHGRVGVYQWLLERGHAEPPTETDELFLACAMGDAPRARSIANGVAGLDRILTPEDQAILAHAAWEGNIPMLRCMLEVGFPPNCAGVEGGTPLHCAAYTGQALSVEMLLEYDPPLENRNNRYSSSPLEWAIHGSLHCSPSYPGTDHARVVKLLLDAGAIPPTYAEGSEEVQRVLRNAGVAASDE